MAKKQGEVRIPSADRKFGFVGDAFISGRDLNALNLQAGDRAAYDEVPGQPGKGPKAANITVVARAAPQAAQTGPPVQTTETTASPVPAKQEKVSVEIATGKEKEAGEKLTLPVAVFVYRGNDPLDKEVGLKADGKQVKKPAPVLSTDANGRVIFQISLDKNATECWFAAEVEGKSYSYLWQKGIETDPLLRKIMIEPKTETTPEAEKISQVGDIHIFRISWQPKLEIKAESTEEIWVRNFGEDDSKWISGTSVPRNTGDSGQIEIEIKMSPGKRGDLYFTAPGWKSQGFYVFPALRLATATKETKGETK